MKDFERKEGRLRPGRKPGLDCFRRKKKTSSWWELVSVVADRHKTTKKRGARTDCGTVMAHEPVGRSNRKGVGR